MMFGKYPSEKKTDVFLDEIESGENVNMIYPQRIHSRYKMVVDLLKHMIVKKEQRYSWDDLVKDKFILYINDLQ